MRVLVACERSGVVRRAFRSMGHDAWSCDLVPADDDSPHHHQDDAVLISRIHYWDLVIAHPDCTFLANSGAKHLYLGMRKENGPNPERWAKMGAAALFFKLMLECPAPMVAVENPIMIGHAKRLFHIPKQTQTIQPWQFGHGETKATCLWLRGLPELTPTQIVDGREGRVWRMPPDQNRKTERSRTYRGIASAMASQWGGLVSDAVAA